MALLSNVWYYDVWAGEPTTANYVGSIKSEAVSSQGELMALAKIATRGVAPITAPRFRTQEDAKNYRQTLNKIWNSTVDDEPTGRKLS